jgi:hypothetical protein
LEDFFQEKGRDFEKEDVNMITDKAPSELNRKELNDAVDDKKALPDLVLKRIIFQSQEELYDSETKLMYNQMRNNGMVNDNDTYRFRVSILKLFRLVSQMALENGCTCLPGGPDKMYNKDDWNLIQEDLAYSKPFSVKMLVRFSAYLTFVLHALNLTNLLISTGFSAKSEDTY